MNIIERLKEMEHGYGDDCLGDPTLTSEEVSEVVTIVENYFSTMACSRGWTMDELCSWLEDNFKGDY